MECIGLIAFCHRAIRDQLILICSLTVCRNIKGEFEMIVDVIACNTGFAKGMFVIVYWQRKKTSSNLE